MKAEGKGRRQKGEGRGQKEEEGRGQKEEGRRGLPCFSDSIDSIAVVR
jgi:hypothetical protein